MNHIFEISNLRNSSADWFPINDRLSFNFNCLHFFQIISILQHTFALISLEMNSLRLQSFPILIKFGHILSYSQIRVYLASVCGNCLLVL